MAAIDFRSIIPRGSAKDRSAEKAEASPMTWARNGFILLGIATLAAVILNFVFLHQTNKPAEPAKESPTQVSEASAPAAAAPTATPAATPSVTDIKLIAYGRELTGDGFTIYVGDKPVDLYVVIEPNLPNPPVYWSVSSEDAASLTVSDDGMSCSFAALQPKGRIELKVRCYGTELVMPVYIWER